MQPITIEIHGVNPQSPQAICDQFLDISRWPEFKGYLFLPGIQRAEFETRTPNLVGSRIRVLNSDGSSHVEEIIEWDPEHRISLRFQQFSAPLKNLATHFIETWELRPSGSQTGLTRSMSMYPSGLTGWLFLLPISRLMKKAFEQQAAQASA